MGDANLGHQQPDEWQRMTERRGTSRAPFVFLKPCVRLIQPVQTLKTTHQWSPRIELRLLERVIETRESLVHRIQEKRVETHIREREKMVLRLTTERNRTEDARMAAASSSPSVKNTALPFAPAPARLPELKLNRTPETKEPRESRHDERSQPANTRGAVAPPLDINALTDQVMRQMDRKLEAHRERMWRK